MNARPIALIAAMPEEFACLAAHLRETARHQVAGLGFREGIFEGVPAVLVGCGIGKVNAAMAATLAFDRFGCRAALLAGVAGGIDPRLGIGDVVVGTRLVQHDYGAVVAQQMKTYQPGVPPLPGFDETYGYDVAPDIAARLRDALDGLDLPAISAAATGGRPRVPRLAFGTIVTGDTFTNCAVTRERLFATFDAQAVEMEGAAVAQVAASFGAPAIVVRALSDLAGAESHMDFTAFLHETAESAARVLRRIAPVL